MKSTIFQYFDFSTFLKIDSVEVDQAFENNNHHHHHSEKT